MLIKVTPHIVTIVKEQTEPINEKEINVSKCHFEFSEEITDEYVKEAYFTLNGNTYKQIIENNECNYPGEILNQKGELEIGVVAFLVENEEEIKRYNPMPDYYSTWKGSLKEAENSEPITPSDKEQIEQQLLNISTQMDNIDIEASKEEHTTTITITRKDGTSYDVEVLDGERGEKGDKGDAGAIKMLIVAELPQTGADDTIYLVPLESPDIQGNNYAEYVYIDNQWELLGKIGVQVDLTDYVKFTDYATDNTSGVIKAGNGLGVLTNSGYIYGKAYTYAQYQTMPTTNVISKATLDNYVSGKGLVSNTDYATINTGGVVRVGAYYGAELSSGVLIGVVRTYDNYQASTNNGFISKGTLENVLTARIGDINSVLDAINGEVI